MTYTSTHTSNEIQVWFLRHGKTIFNYEDSKYHDFIQMLYNGHGTPLAEYPEIDFKSLPQEVDFVGYSPIKRSVETAEVLRDKLCVKQREELEFLSEVKFDKDIISENEFESLKQIRPEILRRWYNNENKAESFKDSLTRVKAIESFLSKRPEKTIILVTHGWFLRLLDVYFVQGKRTDITLDDILGTEPVPLGNSIKATIKATGTRKNSVKLQMEELVRAIFGRYSKQSLGRADRKFGNANHR